jgi:hypothetical protein
MVPVKGDSSGPEKGPMLVRADRVDRRGHLTHDVEALERIADISGLLAPPRLTEDPFSDPPDAFAR